MPSSILTDLLKNARCGTELKRALCQPYSSPELPYKSPEYIIRRYLSNPRHKYKLVQITEGAGNVSGISILREISCNNRLALSLVDFLGNIECLDSSGDYFYKLLLSGNYEYIDYLITGVNQYQLKRTGFDMLEDKKSLVKIPVHFNPFSLHSVDIHFERSHDY